MQNYELSETENTIFVKNRNEIIGVEKKYANLLKINVQDFYKMEAKMAKGDGGDVGSKDEILEQALTGSTTTLTPESVGDFHPLAPSRTSSYHSLVAEEHLPSYSDLETADLESGEKTTGEHPPGGSEPISSSMELKSEENITDLVPLSPEALIEGTSGSRELSDHPTICSFNSADYRISSEAMARLMYGPDDPDPWKFPSMTPSGSFKLSGLAKDLGLCWPPVASDEKKVDPSDCAPTTSEEDRVPEDSPAVPSVTSFQKKDKSEDLDKIGSLHQEGNVSQPGEDSMESIKSKAISASLGVPSSSLKGNMSQPGGDFVEINKSMESINACLAVPSSSLEGKKSQHGEDSVQTIKIKDDISASVAVPVPVRKSRTSVRIGLSTFRGSSCSSTETLCHVGRVKPRMRRSKRRLPICRVYFSDESLAMGGTKVAEILPAPAMETGQWQLVEIPDPEEPSAEDEKEQNDVASSQAGTDSNELVNKDNKQVARVPWEPLVSQESVDRTIGALKYFLYILLLFVSWPILKGYLDEFQDYLKLFFQRFIDELKFEDDREFS